MNSKKKIGFLTTFYEMNPSFSLSTVILQQMEMVHKYGYDPVLFVLTSYTGDLPEYIEVRKVIPQWTLEPYGQTGLPVPDSFSDDVETTSKVYEEHFKDLDCLIAHDICFINTYLIYNVALKMANLNNLPILHQIHSAPSARLMQLGFPWDELWKLPKNCKIIYMNHTEAVAAAEHYGVWPKDVRVVYNPMDLRFMYKLSPLTCNLIEAYDLFSADTIAVYPVSSTRMGDDGKAVRKVISVMAHLKSMGQSVRLLIPNAHANGENEKNIIRELQTLGGQKGLQSHELIFTSMFDVPNNEHGLPHENIIELFQIADLFIFPSYSENAPLILLEAAATKNLLVLNADFQPMLEFLGMESSLAFRFSSRIITQVTYDSGEEAYFKEVAKVVLSDLKNSKPLQAFGKVRKDFNMDAIAKNQLIPTIEEVIHDRVH